jgi:outer membrane immunogenic protein
MRRFIVALLLSVAAVPAAHAADVSVTNKDPWSGLYGGLNVGAGFGASGRSSGGQTYYENASHDSFDTEWYGYGGPSWASSADPSGVVGGAQIGYNRRVTRSLVAGLETDFQGSSLSGDSDTTHSTAIALLPPNTPAGPDYWPVTGTAHATEHVDWFGTVRGRVGLTSSDQSLLVYGTGGLAYGKVRQDFGYSGGFLADARLGFAGTHWSGSASDSETKVGWTAGAGVEWAPAHLNNWSFKVEYLYTDLGSTTANLSTPAYRNDNGGDSRLVNAANTMDARWHTMRVGFNYHFN